MREFNFENLKHLDGGKIPAILEAHIRRAANDCLDRPADSKPRKVTVTFGVVPVLQDDGDCNETKLQVVVKSSIPDHRTKVYSLGLRRNGSMTFNQDSLDDVNQSTLLPEDDDAE